MKFSRITKAARALTAPALAVGLVVSVIGGPAVATHTPANKVAASGSSLDEVSHLGTTVLLQEHVKLNNPTDLILGATAECALITEVTSGATGQTDSAFGEVTVFVTLDGILVPIEDANAAPGPVIFDPDDPNDPDDPVLIPTAEQTAKGEVVFCNRAQEQEWTGDAEVSPPVGEDPPVIVPDEDEDDELRQRLDTMQSNAFNWLALDVGRDYDVNDDNIIDVVLHARHRTDTFDGSVNEGEFADAWIGARTLILEPVKSANDEQVTAVSERG